ncbi:radical SAM/SPASM protein FxsB, inactivated metallohydrolase extension form, partial [Streptomyces sp. NPDC005899]|uniref:radical SAM/SPASM protein FxsBH, inactivated beta-hydroxylase extension form n=1 Tax=Streptomyces sp. NPDC005899 TaxID=3155716 RepID=UPI0033F48D7B
DATAPLEFLDGRVFLPTLGELRIGGPGERGTVRARSADGHLVVRREGGAAELRVARDAGESSGWLPLRRVGGGGTPGFVLDDLDPYRDCFGVPVAPRLAPEDVRDLGARVARAWGLLRERVPRQAADLAGAVTTLTPVRTVAAVAGGHGYGALGAGGAGTDEELALGLLRAFRRGTWQSVVATTDLYASDGTWEHRSPWRREPVSFSTLLSETFERVGMGLFDARFLPGVRQALGTMAHAAELTTDGKRVLTGLEKEIAGLPDGTSAEERPQIVTASGRPWSDLGADD